MHLFMIFYKGKQGGGGGGGQLTYPIIYIDDLFNYFNVLMNRRIEMKKTLAQYKSFPPAGNMCQHKYCFSPVHTDHNSNNYIIQKLFDPIMKSF